jgi:hypothetical protein
MKTNSKLNDRGNTAALFSSVDNLSELHPWKNSDKATVAYANRLIGNNIFILVFWNIRAIGVSRTIFRIRFMIESSFLAYWLSLYIWFKCTARKKVPPRTSATHTVQRDALVWRRRHNGGQVLFLEDLKRGFPNFKINGFS